MCACVCARGSVYTLSVLHVRGRVQACASACARSRAPVCVCVCVWLPSCLRTCACIITSFFVAWGVAAPCAQRGTSQPGMRARHSPAWLKISCAKHAAQYLNCPVGFAMRAWNLYTFSRRYNIEASASIAKPVTGSISDSEAKRFMSASFVVAKIGAVPWYTTWPMTPVWFCGRWTRTGLPSYQRHCVSNGKTDLLNRQSSRNTTFFPGKSNNGNVPGSGHGKTKAGCSPHTATLWSRTAR